MAVHRVPWVEGWGVQAVHQNANTDSVLAVVQTSAGQNGLWKQQDGRRIRWTANTQGAHDINRNAVSNIRNITARCALSVSSGTVH